MDRYLRLVGAQSGHTPRLLNYRVLIMVYDSWIFVLNLRDGSPASQMFASAGSSYEVKVPVLTPFASSCVR